MKTISKTFLCVISLFYTCSSAFSQDKFSFIKQGKVWYCARPIPVIDYNTNPITETYINNIFSYEIKGDTIIDEKNYAKLYMRGMDVYTADYIGKYDDVVTLNCFLLEKDKKVFKRLEGRDYDEMIYDFSLDVNDVFVSSGMDIVTWECHLESISYKQIQGIERYLFNFLCYESWEGSMYDEPFKFYITQIEGIGDVVHPFNYFTEYHLNAPTHTKLLSCYEGDCCIFKSEDFDDFIADIKNTTNRYQKGNETIYDLSGKVLNLEPFHGIYIKDGRKYVK